ncbi:lecithin retinol acyltransferase family protein [Pelagibaculum spongiae]|uniref:LRAT domain-containing protein n=1 Tax=Pelagibaculum spongiae TaxID=2080658 RepID=A0A2V1H2W6_9GAMM|nr:lecithin retinol acyltransferase family protein [Pelagibaculum spongiae]PVZ72320.1 hypothetical protein DC094_04750 [Pelagibaculum spongiae]
MKELIVRPGDVVVTNFSIYQHWSIVTDKLCSLGNPILISATKRNGTVQEEPWHIVTDNKKTYVADMPMDIPISQLLANARSQIGKWEYSITSMNCEHFVKWASGLEVSSTQVVKGVSATAAGIAVAAAVSENPRLLKLLGIGIAIGGLAVLASRAVEKNNTENA